MSKILRCLAGLFILCFIGNNAFAAGYNCPTYRKYTSCNSGYYISECDRNQSNWQNGISVNPNNLNAGNSCKPCPSGYTCSGLLSCPRSSEVTITYNLNGGSGTKPANKICYKGQTCPLNSGNTNSFYRAGYQFVGWATSSTATSGFVIFTPNTISNTMTVYAVWKQCTGATYKDSTANASAACSACPDGYDLAYPYGKTSINECMMYVGDGQYLAERYSSTTERCPAGYACPANGINYGTISEEKPQYFYQCTGATFSTGGSAVCVNCPTATSGWTRGEGVGWTNNSKCYQYRDAKSISSYCSAGQLRQYGNTGSIGAGWSDEIVEYTTFQARPGSVVEGSGINMTCTQCGEGEYSAGGNVKECTACPELTPGFVYNTTKGMSSYTQCVQGTTDPSMANPNCIADPDASQVAVIQTAGSATSWGGSVLAVGVVAKPGAILDPNFQDGVLHVEGYYPLIALCRKCGAGSYSAGGTATSCTACPELTPGFEYTGSAGASSYTQCAQLTRDPSAVNPYCVATSQNTGIWQRADSPTTWNAVTLAQGIGAAPGAILGSDFNEYGSMVVENSAYDFDNMCTQCGVGTYSAGGTATSCTACPELTDGFEYYAETGMRSYTDCVQITGDPSALNPYCVAADSNTVIFQQAGSPTTWDGVNLAQHIKAVPGAILDSGFNEEYGNMQIVGEVYDFNNMCIPCAGNTYSAGGTATSCTSCNRDYTISGTALTNHDSASDCKITCSGGEYVPTAGDGCVNVGAGYWGAGGTVSQTSTLGRNECASGLTTIGSGAGADESGDCGRVLNVGDEKIYLRSTKKTTPSLNISINGDVFYGNMSTATKGSLRINSGGTTYSVYDDSM